MSVINRMLRDLEGQNSQKPNGKNYQPSSSTGSSLSAWRIVVLSILLIAALVWSWMTFTDNSTPASAGTFVSNPVPASVANAAAAPQQVTNNSSSTETAASTDSTAQAVTQPALNMNSGIAFNADSESPVRKVKPTSENNEPVLIPEAGSKGLVAVENTSQSQPLIQIEQTELTEQADVAESPDATASNVSAPQANQFNDAQDGPLIVFASKDENQRRPPANPTPQADAIAKKPATMKVARATPREVEATLRDEIDRSMKSGDTREAIRLLNKLTQREPDNISVRKKLASVYFAEGQIEQAQQLLEQTLIKVPANTSVRLMLGRLYVQQNMHSLAWEAIREPALTNDTDFLGFRAGFAQQQQRFDTALADYNTLVALQPGDARWWLGLGVAADKTNRSHMAVQAYQKALRLQELDDDVETFIRQRISELSE